MLLKMPSMLLLTPLSVPLNLFGIGLLVFWEEEMVKKEKWGLSRFVQYHTCDVDLNNLGALSISPALNVTVQDNTATASATASYDPTKAFCSPPKVTYDLKLTRGPSTGNPPFSNSFKGKKSTGTITGTDLTKSLSGATTGLASG